MTGPPGGARSSGAPVTNESLFERAQRVTPGGVNSPVRAFRSVGGTPYFVARGSGPTCGTSRAAATSTTSSPTARRSSATPTPTVVAAVGAAAAADGTTFGAPTEREVLLAEEICGRVPGVEMVRLVSSGTEATMSAVRLARGVTGRDRIVVFDGCYHGHSDGLLAGGGSGVATLGIPASAGVPASAVAATLVVPYNEVPALDDDVACVIVEPVAANMGLVPPVPGLPRGAARRVRPGRGAADLRRGDHRLPPGLRRARQRCSASTPDLWCFGKVIGGGLPLAAFGGRRDVMEQLAPLGPVYQAGTLSGNPLATAAGLTVLSLLDADAYATLAATGRPAGRRAGARPSPTPGSPPRCRWSGRCSGVFFADEPVTDYAAPRPRRRPGCTRRSCTGCSTAGVAVAPGAVRGGVPLPGPHPRPTAETVDRPRSRWPARRRCPGHWARRTGGRCRRPGSGIRAGVSRDQRHGTRAGCTPSRAAAPRPAGRAAAAASPAAERPKRRRGSGRPVDDSAPPPDGYVPTKSAADNRTCGRPSLSWRKGPAWPRTARRLRP